MSLDKDDIRAAVGAGLITEPQAASLMSLADQRRGTRENMDGLDEPFELFRGFNEIFIVIGLGILYAGWLGITGVSAFTSVSNGSFSLTLILFGGMSILCCFLLARYFTLKRRMVGPSIMLVLMLVSAGIQVGGSLSGAFDFNLAFRTAFTSAITVAVLAAFYTYCRIPVTMFFMALGVFVGTGALFVLGGAETPSPGDIFQLTGSGSFAYITIALGLIGLAIALRLDMSDPHRVTRHAASAFWLHVIAAPAIVNTVALTLFEVGSFVPQVIMLFFLILMASFAIIIDRRSFLIAGIGYIVALAVALLDGNAAIVILALGIGLVLLGAKWEVLRGKLLHALPDFPGKDKLPPWGLTETTL
jgi:hypothetical protein